MKYRKVGKSGLKVSEISLGSWLTYGDKVDKAKAFEILNTAVDHGINFIDSAEIYAKGKAESVIGDWLKEGTVNRNDLVISTKVFWPMSENINRWGLHRKNILTAITGSIERLGTTPDILFCHRYDYQTPLMETVQVLNELVEKNKIHYWGTSAWTAAQLERAHAIAKEFGYHRPIVEQPMYNMLFRHIELEIMPTAKNLGMGFTVFSPLGGGILTGKYNSGIPEGSRATWADFVSKNLTEENLTKVRKITEIAKSMELSTSQLALAWNLRRKELSSTITGATSRDHVLQNVKASDVTLSTSTIEEINAVLDNAPQWPDTYAPNLYHEDEMRKF